MPEHEPSTLVETAIESTDKFYDTLQKAQSKLPCVHTLVETLGDLRRALSDLAESGISTAHEPFSLLSPFLQIFTAVSLGLNEQVVERSGHNPKEFRGWAKLVYRNDTLIPFTLRVACYRSAISIALLDANLPEFRTNEELDQCKGNIDTCIDDLKIHLECVKESIHEMKEQVNGEAEFGSDSFSLYLIEKEQFSIEHHLKLCNKLSTVIDDLACLGFEPSVEGNLEEYNNSMNETTTSIEGLVQTTVDKIITEAKVGDSLCQNIDNLLMLREALAVSYKARELLSKAAILTRNDTSTIHMYCYGKGAMQVFGSGNAKTLNGKAVLRGDQASQCGGHYKDDTVKLFAPKRNAEDDGNVKLPSRNSKASPNNRCIGPGRTLSGKSASQ